MTSSRQRTVIEGTCAILELMNSLADVNFPALSLAAAVMGVLVETEVPQDARTVYAKLACGGQLLPTVE